MRVHPIDFTESLLVSCKVCEAQISVYRYHPQSLWDDRTIYNIAVGQLRSKYEELAKQISGQEDVAFDSIVTVANRKTRKHFGLVDFNTPEKQRAEEASNLLIKEYRVP